jgi:hypothetical protein
VIPRMIASQYTVVVGFFIFALYSELGVSVLESVKDCPSYTPTLLRVQNARNDIRRLRRWYRSMNPLALRSSMTMSLSHHQRTRGFFSSHIYTLVEPQDAIPLQQPIDPLRHPWEGISRRTTRTLALSRLVNDQR